MVRLLSSTDHTLWVKPICLNMAFLLLKQPSGSVPNKQVLKVPKYCSLHLSLPQQSALVVPALEACGEGDMREGGW